MKTTALLLLALALTLPRAAHAGATKNLVETAQAAGQFETLLAAAGAAGLAGALTGPGPLTLFAPTDEAFAAIPKETLAKLLLPENKAQLARILTYHVVAGRVLSTDLLTTASAPSLAGPALAFGLRVGNANVIAADILCSNGVIHVIDKVLLPPEATPMPASPVTALPVVATLEAAIHRGVPIYNAGDMAGCADIYEQAARALVASPGALAELHAMDLGVLLGRLPADGSERAWALRRGFDRILADEDFLPRVEAPLPEGFPAPGPVGRVMVKNYPSYRAARAEGSSAFMTLFGHIQRNDVKMTSPVEMTLDETLAAQDMAFLYERPGQGTAGAQGQVAVLDLPARRVLSIGLRGDRTETTLVEAKAALEARIARDGLKVTGPYRSLGYNSPMVPAAQRFWELQVPIEQSAP